jgi:hypothetical protein
MDNPGDLELLLRSRYPLLIAEERDEERFIDQVRRAAGSLDLPPWTWSSVKGLARDGRRPSTRHPMWSRR